LFNTTSHSPIGFSYDVITLPGIVRFRIGFAVLVLIGVYGLIAFEVVHRTIAAMVDSLHSPSYLNILVIVRLFIIKKVLIVTHSSVFLVLVLVLVVLLLSQFGAFVALAILSKVMERPSLPEVAGWIDYNTCSLLFGMMIMVGLISQTGCFEWAAVKMYRFSKVCFLSLFFLTFSSHPPTFDL
jgi:Na+/H+ antiporter NhaD/arsenite permease-like protein